MSMTFLEANEAVKKLAGGKSFFVQYQLFTYSFGNQRPTCSVYVEDYGKITEALTWEEAIYQMEIRLGSSRPVDENQQPVEVRQ